MTVSGKAIIRRLNNFFHINNNNNNNKIKTSFCRLEPIYHIVTNHDILQDITVLSRSSYTDIQRN